VASFWNEEFIKDDPNRHSGGRAVGSLLRQPALGDC
jgi:hypothetical protein